MERYYWNLEPDNRERIHEITPPGDNPPYTFLKKIGKLALTRTPDLIRLGGGNLFGNISGSVSAHRRERLLLSLPLGGLCCRKMSVRLSVTRRYCVETDKRVIKRLSPSGSHTSLVSPHQREWQFQTGASNARGGILGLCLGLSHNDTRYSHIVITECDKETVPKLSNGTIFNDFERPRVT